MCRLLGLSFLFTTILLITLLLPFAWLSLRQVFLRSFKLTTMGLNPLLLPGLLFIPLFLIFLLFLLLLSEEVFTGQHLIVFFSEELFRWERSVFFLLLDDHLLSFHVSLLEMRQESLPILFSKLRLLFQLSLDHQFFDIVNWVYISHRVKNYPSYGFEVFKMAHC